MLEFVVYLPPFKVFKLRSAVILKDVLKHQHCVGKVKKSVVEFFGAVLEEMRCG